MASEFLEILEKHNNLQKRIEKANEIFEKTQEFPETWQEAYSKLLDEQSDNFERLYKIFERAYVDRLVNNNGILQPSDFEGCKVR
jgi:translation initiation factor 2 alpha subunit (eIF-2alpha)